ncbi:hypothetical protein HaLaN_11641 [Haematococcus lacustris]|uniref:Uncharacterized protein n=1 Tax=Haematococcus lacustris TaxID=44745 RepID=A0A699YYP9_HAELA|nr:hypothetical protein HaLaN_11641 [Haematococcus lacustris]
MGVDCMIRHESHVERQEDHEPNGKQQQDHEPNFERQQHHEWYQEQQHHQACHQVRRWATPAGHQGFDATNFQELLSSSPAQAGQQDHADKESLHMEHDQASQHDQTSNWRWAGGEEGFVPAIY